MPGTRLHVLPRLSSLDCPWCCVPSRRALGRARTNPQGSRTRTNFRRDDPSLQLSKRTHVRAFCCSVLVAPTLCSLAPMLEDFWRAWRQKKKASEMEARREGTCALCCAAIAKGALVLPVDIPAQSQAPGGGARTQWLHKHCVSESDVAVCKHWQRTGQCMYEGSCVFAHPAGRTGAKDTLECDRGGGAGREASSKERSWQRESERGQPVRLHASRIPLCMSVDLLTELFAQYGQLVDSLEVDRSRLRVHMHAFECAAFRLLRLALTTCACSRPSSCAR